MSVDPVVTGSKYRSRTTSGYSEEGITIDPYVLVIVLPTKLPARGVFAIQTC